VAARSLAVPAVVPRTQSFRPAGGDVVKTQEAFRYSIVLMIGVRSESVPVIAIVESVATARARRVGIVLKLGLDRGHGVNRSGSRRANYPFFSATDQQEWEQENHYGTKCSHHADLA